MLAADEVFLSGTGAELVPVGRIDGHQLARPAEPLYPRIRIAFLELIERECRA